MYIKSVRMCVAFIHKFFISFSPNGCLKSHQRERICLQPTLLTPEGSYSDDLVLAITVALVPAPVTLLPATVEIRSGGDAFILLPPLFS